MNLASPPPAGEQAAAGCGADAAAGASFDRVLGEEVAHLRALREKEGLPPGDAAGDTAAARAKSAQLLGLAFSGGGIRSATFNLGILQALARHDLLRQFDYLSTVSGGGYIGAWLSALLHHKRNHDWARQLLIPPPVAGVDGSVNEYEAPALRFLRRYSNYLTPRLGMLSGDTLAAIATYLRNLGLNLATLVSLGMATVLLPHLLVHGGVAILAADSLTLLVLAACFALFAVCFSAIGLASASTAFGHSPPPVPSSLAAALLILLPVAIAAALLALVTGHNPVATFAGYAPWLLAGAFVYAAFWILGFLLIVWATPHHDLMHRLRPGDHFVIAGFTLLAGMVGGVLLRAGLGSLLLPADGSSAYHQSWWALGAGVPVGLGCIAATVALHIGLLRRYLTHEAREWWSRTGGLLLGLIAAWAAMFALVTYSPALLRWLQGWVWQVGGVWTLLVMAGVWLAKSPLTGGENSRPWIEAIARIAPWLFLVGIGILLAAGSHALLQNVACERCAPIALDPPYQFNCNACIGEVSVPGTYDDCTRRACFDCQGSGLVSLPLCRHVPQVEQEIALFDFVRTGEFFLAFLAAFGLLGYRIDTNLFSIHHFYRDRLVRAYLGAARFPERDEHPYTGFSRADDLPLHTLADQRPFHILNAAVNLSGGEELAWQTRRAASFTFTPLYCGYEYHATRTTDPGATGQPHGPRGSYRPSACFQSKWGVYLGTAMGISGAAASPLSGYHTRPHSRR